MKHVLLFLFASASLFANYVGNPESPAERPIICRTKEEKKTKSWLMGRLEYEKEYVGNMNLEFQTGSLHQRAQNGSFSGNFATFTTNLFRRLGLYLKGGAVEPNFNFAFIDFGEVTTHLQTNVKMMTAWGAGAKLLVFRKDHAAITVETSYFQALDTNFRLYPSRIPSHGIQSRIGWHTWQVSTGLSYRIAQLVPYIGGKYSRTLVSLSTTPTSNLSIDSFNMENRRRFGLFLGCTFLPARTFDLTIEGRFVDESAISGTLAFRF